MAESNLSITFSDLQGAIGHHMGFGRDTGDWTADQTTWVASIIERGQRAFYYPEQVEVDGRMVSHVWSFMRETNTLDTVASDYDYDLPDDYAGLYGDIEFTSASQGQSQIQVIPQEQLLRLRAIESATTDYPQFAATRIKTGADAGANGDRWELILWPTPGSVYTLIYDMIRAPSSLNSQTVYPLGGTAHGQTILYACLSEAEFDNTGNPRSIWYEKFLRSLVSSVKMDQKLASPKRYGRMKSGRVYVDRHDFLAHQRNYNTVSYNP